MRMPGSSALLTAGAVLAALVVAPVGSADASSTPSARDSATASGRHFYTLREADVIAGSPSTYLVITYTAGRQLTDGTIRIVLPGSQWRTPLSASTLVTESDNGTVAVRPWTDGLIVLPEPEVDPATACPLAGAPNPWTVQTVLGSQVIVVRHVNCAPGRTLFVHIKGITAPTRVGRYHLPVVASDRSGPVRLSAAAVDVVPTPRLALQVTMPATVPTGPGVRAVVRAVRPDGSTATDYTGAVALVSEDANDCSFSPSQDSPYQFTRADAGVASIPVSFGQAVSHRLRAYDIANKAVSGVSAPFEVVSSGPPSTCPAPASYH